TASLIEGRLPETVHGWSEAWRPAAAARNHRPGRPGTPSAGHYDPAARSSLHGSGGNAGDGRTGPGPKSPRGSAERRAGPRRRTLGASQAPRRAALRHVAGAAAPERRLGAPPPLVGGRRKVSSPGRRARRGNEKGCSRWERRRTNRAWTNGLPRGSASAS